MEFKVDSREKWLEKYFISQQWSDFSFFYSFFFFLYFFLDISKSRLSALDDCLSSNSYLSLRARELEEKNLVDEKQQKKKLSYWRDIKSKDI